jgi:pyruvate dehydrogenase E2 component (dihydrolipoamide acetyltransferase)
MFPVIMPQIGQDSPTGRIVQWLKRENDAVQKGEVILTVESEKAVFEVTAEQSGVLLKVLYSEGDEVEIFKPLAYVRDPGEVLNSAPTPSDKAAILVERCTKLTEHEEPAATSAHPPETLGLLASPAVRRLAREHGVDLQAIHGTGPNGRITQQDVAAACGEVALSPEKVTGAKALGPLAEDTVVRFSPMRQRIADRLSLSAQTIPHFYIFADVDMTQAQEQRAAANHQPGVHLTVTDLLIKAVALALQDHPRLNSLIERERMTLKAQINIGVATAVGGDATSFADSPPSGAPVAPASDGLLVPVIPQADRRTVLEISSISREVSAAARRGVVDPNPAATFTISSLGKYGIGRFLPLINPPECANLGVGTIEPRAMPIPGGLGVREMMTLTLACDHRAVDGAYAAGFLNSVKDCLQNFDQISSTK